LSSVPLDVGKINRDVVACVIRSEESRLGGQVNCIGRLSDSGRELGLCKDCHVHKVVVAL
jgi:hypothetical protein